MSDRSDTVDNIQLVLHEREARGRRWWDKAIECFHPDSSVHISWFQGSGPEFVAASRQLTDRGDTTTHQLGPPIVHLGRGRALVVLPMRLAARSVVRGVEVDLSVSVRLLYRTERRQRSWRIARLEAIYERDTLTPAIPGQALAIPRSELAPLRPSYRMLMWYFAERGILVSPEELGDDQPDRVAAAYRDAFDWLRTASRYTLDMHRLPLFSPGRFLSRSASW